MRDIGWVLSSRLRTGCLLLAFVLLIGTVGFIVVEGWTPIQAFYTAVLVVSTLGFSDLRPSDSRGQILTIGLIGAGVGMLYYLVGALAQTIIEEQLDWRKRQAMEDRVVRLKDHFIVCGFGRVGQQTCQQLSQEHCIFVVIDNDDSRIMRIHGFP
jgi:voltage-gated potassium channel